MKGAGFFRIRLCRSFGGLVDWVEEKIIQIYTVFLNSRIGAALYSLEFEKAFNIVNVYGQYEEKTPLWEDMSDW
jgi:hypothetical protein